MSIGGPHEVLPPHDTTRDYIKACSTNRSELEGWAARTVNGVPRACGVCSP